MKKLFKAFTLIELLIVIVIIGILAVALIPRLKGMQDKAKYIRVQRDFEDMWRAVFLAQTNKKMTMPQLLWVNEALCTYYDPDVGYNNRTHVDYRNLPENDTCRVNLRSALRKIEIAADLGTWALAHLEKDPWGSPYRFEPNDGVDKWLPWWACALWDTFATPGKDGYYSDILFNDMVTAYQIFGDDRLRIIRPIGCPGWY